MGFGERYSMMLQCEKYPYQGIASVMPSEATILSGFSRRACPSRDSG